MVFPLSKEGCPRCSVRPATNHSKSKPTSSSRLMDHRTASARNDQPEGEVTSSSQNSNSASHQHEQTVRDLEEQIINLKMDLAEEKDRNGHLTQSKVDLERELSMSQKSHGALLVESTRHKLDAQNAMRENESHHAKNGRLRAEMEEMKKQRLHAGMVATIDRDSNLTATSSNPELHASDGSLGNIMFPPCCMW